MEEGKFSLYHQWVSIYRNRPLSISTEYRSLPTKKERTWGIKRETKIKEKDKKHDSVLFSLWAKQWVQRRVRSKESDWKRGDQHENFAAREGKRRMQCKVLNGQQRPREWKSLLHKL